MRAYFDTVLDDYPTLSDRLDADARILHNPYFESGLLKVQEMSEETLTPTENQELEYLLLKKDFCNDDTLRGNSIIERAAKRLRASGGKEQLAYLDTRFLLPTSNIFERFFSISGFALTNRRKGLLPSNFGSQLFLCLNRDFWGIDDVRDIVKE